VQVIGDVLKNLIGAAEKVGGGAPTLPADDSNKLIEDAMAFGASVDPLPRRVFATLPELLAAIRRALTPDTLRTLAATGDPEILLGIIAQALSDLASGAPPDVPEPTGRGDMVDRLALPPARALAFASALSGGETFRRVSSVRLHFADLSPQLIAGRPQVAFRNDRDLTFPLVLETPRPIPQATLTLRVKDPKTLRVLVTQRVSVPGADAGRLAVVPRISIADAERLRPGKEYLVHLTLRWRGRSGPLGTTMAQLITIVGEETFDRIEQTTDVVPLNDVEAYRDFWHKAWQGTFDATHRRATFNCRYTYALDPEAASNAQMETNTDTTVDAGYGESGTLRSGLVLSLYRLNDLLARAASGAPQLTEAELAGLRTPAFVSRFAQAARTQVRFRGRAGDSAALWVFPEVKLQQVVLRRADVVNDAGHVVRFAEHRVRFPIPVLAHVVGVASQ
jgi:hypothetical protein